MRETESKGWFWHWGMAMYRYRKVVLVGWLLLFIGLGWFAQKAPGLMNDSGFTPKGSDSDKGLLSLQEKLGAAPSQLTFVYSPKEGTGEQEESQTVKAILESLEPVKALPYVSGVQLNPAARKEGGPPFTRYW
ncbi:hypothetical protein N6H14_00730 [Paenibacillus sp. CC-CFT747]|nr:hypothetical protein N6H14_00730 [Paenibacillus sp. CC-CFT747]